jgi:hypothetical protein
MQSATQTLSFTIEGLPSSPLLLNNPRTVDPFDRYAIEKKKITGKRSKTDEDQYRLRQLDVESSCYFASADPADPDYDPHFAGLGIYVPSSWIIASIAGCSWTRAKIKKAEIRAAVFPMDTKIKLRYQHEERISSVQDIALDSFFVNTMLLKQGQVKIPKSGPIFHDWRFTTSLTFDPNIIDRSTIIDLLTYAAQFGGYGDFRPSFGRAAFKELEVAEYSRIKDDEAQLMTAASRKFSAAA